MAIIIRIAKFLCNIPLKIINLSQFRLKINFSFPGKNAYHLIAKTNVDGALHHL